ncbi:hypothetical protein ES708_32031 [subsurface metagenome]
MLPSRPAGPEYFYLQFIWRYLDINISFGFRHNLHQGKGGMPSMVGIKGGKTDQAMNAVFRFQIATGITAANPDNRILDTCLFPRRSIQHLSFITASLCPAKVHSQQHFCPILRLGAPCPGMYCHDSISGIILAGKSHFQLRFIKARSHLFHLRLNLCFQRGILLSQRSQLSYISYPFLQFPPLFHHLFLLG